MCIAVFRPKGVKIRKKVLKQCFEQNPDGAGFAFPTKNAHFVKIVKGFFTFRSFWHSYRQYQERDEPMVIHFRVATSGQIDSNNCHPWRINKENVLIHNGVLEHKLGLQDNNLSDTGLFVRHVLAPIFNNSPEIWRESAFKWMIEECIGYSNKLVVLNKNGDHIIFNEKAGDWFEGAWFSNTTYKTERKKKRNFSSSTCVNYSQTKTSYSFSGQTVVKSNESQPVLSLEDRKPNIPSEHHVQEFVDIPSY